MEKKKRTRKAGKLRRMDWGGGGLGVVVGGGGYGHLRAPARRGSKKKKGAGVVDAAEAAAKILKTKNPFAMQTYKKGGGGKGQRKTQVNSSLHTYSCKKGTKENHGKLP